MIDTRTFLKENSPISNEFIDGFLLFYNPDTIQTDFVVDLSLAAKWLRANKYKLVQTLKASYTEGIDYLVTKGKRPVLVGRGANNNKMWLLSPDCFKRMCMRSNTKRAEEVRTYFIQLEGLISRYKTVMLNGMQAEIKKLNNAVRPKNPEDGFGYIYVIKASDDKQNVYKIGRTKDLLKRVSNYSTGRLDGVQVVYKFRTDNFKRTEACVKLMLKDHQLRKYKEVYEANIDMIKTIIQKCDETVTYTRVYSNAKAEREMKGGYYFVLDKNTE